MNRRTALKLLGTLLAVAMTEGPVRRRLRFHVAGARYYGPPREVDRVTLRVGHFRGDPSIAVLDPDGRQLGWVPRALVAPVLSTRAVEAAVIACAPNGVPWRWYRIEVC